MNIDEAIEKLKGIDCRGKGTSCPDQLSKALIEYKILINNKNAPSFFLVVFYYWFILLIEEQFPSFL